MKRILILLLMHYHIILPEENIAEIPINGLADATIVFNFNLSNVDNSHNVNNARINTNQNLSQAELDSNDMPWTLQDIKSFATNYRWGIAGAIALSSYGLLCYYAIKGNHYLKRLDLWASWDAEEVTAQELFREIKNRYKKDFATSLVLFIKEIDQEEKNIRWYQSLYHWVGYLHIQKLLPFDATVYKNLAQKLERLMNYRACIEAI